MTKGHWQIYNHGNEENIGNFDTLPISKVPKPVIQTALKMAALIGDSLYGVDLKEKNGKAYVIEVNDNPNIDADVEDAILGEELYHVIIHEFIRRIEAKK
jgi:glutathione synthase/RimK-type ligase-like ATP-grasp enzyme